MALAVYIIITSVSVVVLSLYASYSTESIVVDALSDSVLFVFSVLASFYAAKHAAEKAAAGGVAALGTVALRRISILYRDIQTLADSVASYSSQDEIVQTRNQHIVDVLQLLMNAVKASFDEIKQTARLPDIKDEDLYTRFEYKEEKITIANNIQCPICKHVQEVVVASHSGASARRVCKKCENTFDIHRRADGNLFVGKMSGPSLEKRQFVCENCKISGHFKYRRGVNSVKRACLHCFQNFEYVVATDELKITNVHNQEVSWDGSVPVSIECPTCGCHIVASKPFQNIHGQNILFCLQCGVPTLLSEQ